MRYGFTTGSCAAAAAKAAAYMLLLGRKKTEITIETPKGIPYRAQILDIRRTEEVVSCAVQKDGGDDPDVTTGAWIYAKVAYCGKDRKDICSQEDIHSQENLQFPENADSLEDFQLRKDCKEIQGDKAESPDRKLPYVQIDGGIGVGRVTKPGLDQPVGNAAINHVPREMITKEVLEVCRLADYKGGLAVEIFVPEGEQLAEQTFNPRLGITGGISILGSSGIVEPMSSQAILDTIRVELRQRRAEGYAYVAVAPGNYGLDFMKQAYGYDLDKSIKCSNFIGNMIDMAVEEGFQKLLLTGHIGKLIKVAGGIMNTHSKEGDCRMELITASAIRQGISVQTACEILACVTTEEAVRILEKNGKRKAVMEDAMEHICYYLNKRAMGKMQIDCIMYANEFGELAKSKGAEQWFTLLAQEQGQPI